MELNQTAIENIYIYKSYSFSMIVSKQMIKILTQGSCHIIVGLVDRRDNLDPCSSHPVLQDCIIITGN